MIRRLLPSHAVASGAAAGLIASLRLGSTLDKNARDAITKQVARVKEEAKGQLMDLSDMNDASRNVSNALQETVKRNSTDADPKIKGKLATLTASLKAYNTRLSNLQNEARSVQSEADAIMKLLWGTGAADTASTATPQAAAASTSDDFDVEVPPMAKKIEQILEKTGEGQTATATASASTVETVEGDFIKEDLTQPKSASGSSGSSGSGSNGGGKAAAVEEDLEIEVELPEESSPADTTPIPEITQALHEAGVNFSDCKDATALRSRYKDFLAGKFNAPKPAATKSTPQQQQYAQQPPPPRQPQQYQQQQQQYQQPPPNTTETGLASDPYPNATRKMVDPNKTVFEVKMDIAKERGMDPNTMALWSGQTMLLDHKRLYEYPTIQQFPIEVRHKGDTPS